MIRLMLKQWLDTHLPDVVERVLGRGRAGREPPPLGSPPGPMLQRAGPAPPLCFHPRNASAPEKRQPRRRRPCSTRPSIPRRDRTAAYAAWEASGAFAGGTRPGCRDLSIVIPPPTSPAAAPYRPRAELDAAGHPSPLRADARQDVLWVPGTDHAGIATRWWSSASSARSRPAVRPRPRKIRGAGLGMEGGIGGTIIVSSAASALDATGAASGSRWTKASSAAVSGGLRRALEASSTGQAPRELGPVDADGDLRPRGRIHRVKGTSGTCVIYPPPTLPIRRRVSSSSPPRGPERCWATPCRGCTRGRALPGSGRQVVRFAAHRPPRADRRRSYADPKRARAR